MVFVQKWPFSQLFSFSNIGQENVFDDILEPKNAFLIYKNKKFKKSKNWNFSKGLTHGFPPKITIFPIFLFLDNIGHEIVFNDILEPKNDFLSYKNKKYKKSKKNWHFSNGVNPWFLSKNCHFFNFSFLSNIGQENVFTDILEPKNSFLSYKNKKFKK